MNTNVADFVEMMKNDKALQDKIREASKDYAGEYKDEDVWNNVLGKIVEEEGFSFTFDDYKKYMDKNSELSEDELKNIAGGEWGYCLIVGGTSGKVAEAKYHGIGACYYVGIGFGGLDSDNELFPE